jgi:putative FmdB family regulatory protein
MPTYEYLCAQCGNQWEEMQKISEPALEVCPKCGQHTAKRQISAGNFILKGGGWYADSYSSKPGKKDAKDDSGGSTTTESTKPAEAGKSEAKSEAPAAKEKAPSVAPAASSGGTKE